MSSTATPPAPPPPPPSFNNSSYATPAASGRRRNVVSRHDAEDSVLNKQARDADMRLNRRRQNWEEARKIREKEIEQQQKLAEADERGSDASGPISHSSSGVINSGTRSDNISKRIDLEEKCAELEKKFEKAMSLYAQMDSQKAALLYEVDLLKDEFEEHHELYTQSQRENRELTSEVKLHKRTVEGLEAEHRALKAQIRQRDTLIQEAGLVLVEKEVDEADACFNQATSSSGEGPTTNGYATPTEQLLLSVQTMAMLAKLMPDSELSLDAKLRKLVTTNKVMKQQLEEAESQLNTRRLKMETERLTAQNGPDIQEMQMSLPDEKDMDDAEGLHEIYYDTEEEARKRFEDAAKQVADIKFKLQEADRENSSLQGTIVRLESQLKRAKSQAESGEAENSELKAANRQAKKELREIEIALDEAKENNKHLQNRLEKLRSSRPGRSGNY